MRTLTQAILTRAATLLALGAFACDAASSNNPQPTRYGSISVTSASDGITPFAPRAFFYKYASSTSAACDEYQNNGTCRVWQCDSSVYSNSQQVTVLSAGAVGVSGAKQALDLTQDSTGSYGLPGFDGAPLWDGGETLTANVAGSTDYPATTLSVQAPAPLVVTAPEVPTDAWTIDTKTDFSVTWKPNGANYVFLAITVETPALQADGTMGSNYTPGLDCAFAGASGQGTVPASYLQLLPKPPELVAHALDVLTFSTDEQRIGDSDTELRANWLALSAQPTFQ